jgi:hypothetical protein
MSSSEAQRTLVKSPPELWAELSDPDSLSRHLGHFGEIRIARIEPETTVEWEADAIAGAVHLSPSGWGTKVTLSITRRSTEPEPEPEAVVEPEPEARTEAEAPPEPAPETRRRRFANLFRRSRRRAEQPEPEAIEEDDDADRPPDLAAELAEIEESLVEQDSALLTDVLDRLGAAHHRPFSRG